MFRDLSEAVRYTAAKSTLNGLMLWLGEAGLAAAAAMPGLLSAVDQHSASVREALGDPEPGPGAVSLAGYATGVRDSASEQGWPFPQPSEVDWTEPDWPTMRLLAVCALARSGGYA